MKLEFKANLIHDHAFKELEFQSYLDYFQIDCPMIAWKILLPLSSTKAINHFQRLQHLDLLIKREKFSWSSLFKFTSKLSNLENTLKALKQKRLLPHHLFELGHFCETDLQLSKIETNSLQLESNPAENILQILRQYLTTNFGSFIQSPHITDLLTQNDLINQNIALEQQHYEKAILKATAIQMIHPWPKEIPYSLEQFNKLKSCPLICVTKRNNILMLDYNPPKKLQTLLQKKEKITKKINLLTQQHLKAISLELFPFYTTLKNYYEKRKIRLIDYAYLNACIKHQLVLPVIQETTGLEVVEGRLPLLQNNQDHHYVPLSLSLRQGANVLFGANMAGKTTVLKTLYFLTELVRFGLPVPAKTLSLHFPEEPALLLKSSGTVQKNLSSFAEEVSFFATKRKSKSYIFVDELFQTTNPIAGQELANIFLNFYNQKNGIFFCTTHYPEVIFSDHFTLYRMKDINPDDLPEELTKKQKSLDYLLKYMPYKLEEINKTNKHQALEESKKPLWMALHFPIDLKVKKQIELKLKG